MKYQIPIFFCLTVLIGLNACKEDEFSSVEEFYYQYFPIEVGTWYEYQIDSIHHDITSDTSKYFLREEIAPFDTGSIDKNIYQLKRFIRHEIENPWKLKQVWLVEKKENAVEIVEENIRYVKLIFPIRSNQNWDGNIYNNLDPQKYRISEIHEPYIIGEHNFDSTITIEQKLRVNLIDSIISKEKYATNIGLIEKTDINLDFGSGKIKGTEFRKKLLNYKN